MATDHQLGCKNRDFLPSYKPECGAYSNKYDLTPAKYVQTLSLEDRRAWPPLMAIRDSIKPPIDSIGHALHCRVVGAVKQNTS